MKISRELLQKIVSEETAKVLRSRGIGLSEEDEPQGQDKEEQAPVETDEKGSEDEVDSAKEQGMKSDVERVAKFMFKHPQLSKA